MTSVQRAAIVGGGPMAAPAATSKAAEDTDEQAFVQSDRIGEDGITVDRRPGIRTTLLMIGLGAIGGGAMAFGASRLPMAALQNSIGSSSMLKWGGIAAAGVGAVLTSIGLTQGADKVPYLYKVSGDREEALAKAAEAQKDVGVVQVSQDKWGVIDLSGEDTAIDDRGPDGIKLGKPPVPFNAFVSEFGDAFVKAGKGWDNIGAPNRIDASDISSGDLDELVGAQLGVNDGGQRITLGKPLDGTVHPQRADAVRTSFEAGDDNVAIVKVKDGYAAFAIDGGTLGEQTAARGFRVEPFGAVEILRPEGLVAASAPAGSFDRIAMPVDDVTKVKAGDAASLTGRRIGDGQLRLGAHVGTFESVAKGGAELFEKSTGPVVFLSLDGGVAAYKVPRAFERFDTMLGGGKDAVTLLDSTTLLRPAGTGDARSHGRLPRFDVTGVPVAKAETLEGRRIGTGNVELGKLVKTYPSVEAAGADQFEAGAPFRVVLKLQDGAAVFESRPFQGFETLLGGDRAVYSLNQADWATTTDTDRTAADAGDVKVINAGTLPIGSAAQLVGKRFAMDGSSIVRITGIASTHGSLADAMRVAAGQGGNRYVVSMQGGSAIVSLSGSGSDVETGIHPAGQLTQVNGRLAFGTGGESWSFRSRSIPFQVNEPIGHNLSVGGWGGSASYHTGSYHSQSSAYSSFERSLRDDTFAVVQSDGPAGTHHVYELRGGGGSSWDERLGDVIAVSKVFSSYDDYYRTDEGSPGNETVYYIEERRTWRELRSDSGTRTTADTGIDRDTSIDWGRTNALRAQREREREEARRRAEEAEARRKAEEEARRKAEEERRKNEQSSGSGSSGGSSGSSGGSGSGGNSNPGSGGGYDPNGSSSGSDW